MFVEHDRDAVRRRVGNLAAAVRQLGDLRRPGDPLEIALDQIGLGRAADLPSGHDVEQHLLLVGGRAERPGEYRLEAVVDRTCALGDRPGPVGAATREYGDGYTASI